MNYDITICSVTDINYEKTIFDNYEKALALYKEQVDKLKDYKVISSIKLSQGYCHNNTFKELEKIKFQEKIKDEKLSLTCNKKLKELFECISSGNSYYREGEFYWNENSSKYEIDRKEEFNKDPFSANKEFDKLLAENEKHIKKEDEEYERLKGPYRCIIGRYDCNIYYLGNVTIPNRIEKIKSNYINYNYKFKEEYSFNEEIIMKCSSYNNLSNRELSKYKDLPRTTGTANDFVILLEENEYKELLKECKQIETNKKIEYEQERLKYEQMKKEREQWENTFIIKKQINLVYPRGGEDGTDGYYRVIIQHKDSQNKFDIILRNVFDGGCWSMIANKEGNLTDEEKLACKWVYDHAPFTTNIRM